jgi:hypothetical protein
MSGVGNDQSWIADRLGAVPSWKTVYDLTAIDNNWAHPMTALQIMLGNDVTVVTTVDDGPVSHPNYFKGWCLRFKYSATSVAPRQLPMAPRPLAVRACLFLVVTGSIRPEISGSSCFGKYGKPAGTETRSALGTSRPSAGKNESISVR